MSTKFNLFGGSDPAPQTEAPQANAQPTIAPRKGKGMWDFGQYYPNLQKILRFYCSLAALAMVLCAGYAIGTPRGSNESCSSLDYYFYLISAWLVILGIVSILVEWRIDRVRNLFQFLNYKTGRGFFYIFVGSLTTGITSWISIIVGVAVVVAGLLTFGLSFLIRRAKKNKRQTLASQGAREPVTV